MKFGAIIFATDKSIQPIELATEIEGRGLDSFFVPEHTHIPTDTSSPFFPMEKYPTCTCAPMTPSLYWVPVLQ